MRTIFSLIICLSLFSSCTNKKSNKVPETFLTSIAEYHISGMTCTGCESTIKSSVSKLDGVKEVSASYIDSTAIVKFDSTAITLSEITKQIKDLGYEVISVSSK